MAAARATLRSAVVVALLVTSAAWLWMSPLAPRSSTYSIDLYFLFYPAHFRFGEEVARGHLPVWNPDLGLGINELADSQFGFLYPPNLLFAVMSTAHAIDVLAGLHFVLATGSTLLLCLAYGLSLPSAAVAAAALACGSTLHVLAGWPTMLATFAWCPVAFLAARRLGDVPDWTRTTVLAVVLALQLFAGYLQFSLYTIALLPLFLWPADGRAGVREVGRPLAAAALAAVLALGLAAPGVLPALAAVPGSLRDRANLPEWFYEAAPVSLAHYPLGLSAPSLDGRIAVFTGVLVPLLALGAMVVPRTGRRLRGPALVLTLASLVLSLGRETPVIPLLWKLPIGYVLTNPHKWVFFFSFGLVLLAATGVEAVRSAPRTGERLAWLALGFVLLGVVPFSIAARVAGFVLLLALTFAPARARQALVLSLPVAVVLVTLPAYTERAQRPSDNLNYFVRYNDAYQWLAKRRDAGRTFVFPVMASPRQGEIVRVPQVTTNGTFLSERLDRYMRAVRDAAAPGDAARTIALLRASGARFLLTGHGALPWLADTGAHRAFVGGVGDVWEDPGTLSRVYLSRRTVLAPAAGVLDALAASRVADDGGVVLEAEEGRPSAIASEQQPPGEARILESTDREVRIEIDALRPAILVLLDAWSDEWQASVDGRAVATRHANGVARAVEVPAGRHEVAFRFVPRSLYVGVVASLLSAIVIVAVAVVQRSRRRRTAT